ncbi:Panacea domain-containing protein [Flavobacterium faecale]|uniref:Panacea domain-containing protein n=1 Tax=Flavobacterium faecale TaxID=1355330 RepID=UPI003AAF1434
MEYLIIAVLLIALFLVTLWKEEITKTKVVYISKQDNNSIMSYSPTTIANYFIQEKAKFGKLTSMKLIKLVYISYAWYITLKGKENPLTTEKAQAWKYGPVFPSLYKVIKSEGTIEVEKPLPNDKEEVIINEDAEFLDKIWGLYGKYNGVELSAMTHAENTPWREVYCRDCNSEIPDDLIISHYAPKLKSAS